MQALFLVLALWAVLYLPQSARADDDTPGAVHERLDNAFSEWVTQNGVTGVLGAGVRASDGGWQSHRSTNHTDPALQSGELASVTKSITAVCTMRLVEDGLVDWSNSLRDFIDPAPDVTVAELVTHTSGIGPDATQIAMLGWLGQTPGPTGHFSRQVLDIVNARPEQGAVRGAYSYNNENYALLGLVIEAATGAPYFEVCQARLGLSDSIQPGPDSGVFQPWGGLVSDVDSYLAFLQAHFGPDSAIGADPYAFPYVALGGGAYYGMGMVFRKFGDSYNFWHFGALCFPGRLNTGSFAVMWEGKVSALAMYDACIDDTAMAQLDSALSGAVYGNRP